MRQILGANLSARLQAEALARFVHRSTGEHNGNNGYPIQFANDADWLAHTLFWVTQGGKLSTRAR